MIRVTGSITVMKNETFKYFYELFRLNKLRSNWKVEAKPTSTKPLNPDSLDTPPSIDEIWNAVRSIQPLKAPDSDGHHPFFYQKY